ncbi:uncharacterized protein CcaverHIS019_0104420 [Cutaneotrichosporon cavernicola]|uniref:TPR-like protein n=1 Tax=Cutaneotrichosporon cavernicola TaxID=279322 RepID=A0AA48KWZ9_9TREE|nr:uncharacterized protein CcaverHIS019_0104420 [Cutaneotrichosporon cavernicola]BEI87724.1 hypothetical protein CcaverHIS019_0104420 [Cutaneotrichosporon cavernicola]
MPTRTPPLQATHVTPQHIHIRRRHAPGSAGPSTLSQSFSLGPPDGDISDASIGTPTRRRVTVLTTSEQGNMGLHGQLSPRVRSALARSPGAPSLAPGSEPRTRSRSRLSEVFRPANGHQEEEEDDDNNMDDSDSWTMIDSMRIWRSDAMTHHLYETAAFWANKILDWTGDANDAFWLAQAYYHMRHFVRAERLLTEALPHPKASLLDKGKQKANDLNRNVDEAERKAPIREHLACRLLAAQCLMEQEEYEDALEMLGIQSSFGETDAASRPSTDEGIKVFSSMCYLRGLLHLRLSSPIEAKESFMEALTLDVKNYDAFHELINGQMMKPGEEWEFINTLAYQSQLSDDEAAFVRLMYISKLRKESHIKEISAAGRELATTYGLAENSDVLVGIADELFANYKWEECYVVTSKILNKVPGHSEALTLQLACMHHIPRLHSAIYALAHTLVRTEPHEATTWWAVGMWYYSGQRWADARRYFSKANLIDQRFGPAWITFAHSYRQEGEHDQAITAYSTAARNFPGSHLPYLFIGMSYLQLSLSDLAEEYLATAASYDSTDPLLLNELGVAAYNREDYLSAIEYFEAALGGAAKMQGSSEPWAATHNNMGHALRNLGRYDEAKKHYATAIRLNPTDATAYASQGMISQFLGDVRGAIKLYHQALAILPQEPVATILLEMALTEQVRSLDPTTLPGLPAAIVDKDLDPFNVPKGNPVFGPLPIDVDPLTFEEAGDASLFSVPGSSTRTVVPHIHVDDMTSMSMSISMAASHRLRPDASIMDESSVMDIEED